MGKIGSLFWEITAETSKFVQGMNDSKKKAGEFKSNLNEVVQGLTGFNVSTLAGAGAVVALGNAVKGAVNDAAAYANTVRQMARITGESTEETSRLIQLTDDLGVSESSLQAAMEGAARKGIAFNTESLARLADEYVSLSDPVARNTLLLDNFGRSGLDMAAAMSKGGDAIREMSGTVADNLVLTQEQVDAAREYEIALDNVNDAIAGVKMQLGNALIPALSDSINWFTAQAKAQEMVSSAGMTYAEKMEAMRTTTIALYNAQQDQVQESGLVKVATDNLRSAKEGLASATWNAKSGFDALPASMQKYITDADRSRTAAENLARTMNERLNASMQAYNTQLQFQIASEGLSAEQKLKLAMNMGLIDEKSRYAIAKTQEWRDELEKGNLTIDEYNRKVAQLANDLQRIESKQVMIDVWINQHGGIDFYSGPGSPEDQNPRHKNKNTEYARGGSFVIPAQYGYEGFSLGGMATASAGETVTITPAGKSAGNTVHNTISITVNGAGSPAAVADAIALRLASYGSRYQGS